MVCRFVVTRLRLVLYLHALCSSCGSSERLQSCPDTITAWPAPIDLIGIEGLDQIKFRTSINTWVLFGDTCSI